MIINCKISFKFFQYRVSLKCQVSNFKMSRVARATYIHETFPQVFKYSTRKIFRNLTGLTVKYVDFLISVVLI